VLKQFSSSSDFSCLRHAYTWWCHHDTYDGRVKDFEAQHSNTHFSVCAWSWYLCVLWACVNSHFVVPHQSFHIVNVATSGPPNCDPLCTIFGVTMAVFAASLILFFFFVQCSRQDLSNKTRCRPDFWTESSWVLCPVKEVCNFFPRITAQNFHLLINSWINESINELIHQQFIN